MATKNIMISLPVDQLKKFDKWANRRQLSRSTAVQLLARQALAIERMNEEGLRENAK